MTCSMEEKHSSICTEHGGFICNARSVFPGVASMQFSASLFKTQEIPDRSFDKS